MLWRVTSAENVPVNPAFDSGTVYFGSGNHEVLAVDGRTGAVRWRSVTGVTGGQTAGFNVVVAGGVVAMGDIDVYAFDRRTGAPRWTFRAPDLDETGTRSLAADAQTVYAASLRGRVYALDANTGQARWVTDLAQGDSTTASFDPTVADGVVYVGTKMFNAHATGRFVALDAATGSVRWAYNFTPEHQGQYAGCFGGAVVWGQLVIVGQEDGRIFAFDRATGSVVWTAPSVRLPTMEGGTPWYINDRRYLAIAGDTLIATSLDGTVLALDAATGQERWRNHVSTASILSRPGVDGTVVWATHAGVFVAHDLATGQVRWQYPPTDDTPAEYASTAIPDGDRIYVAGFHGFYALRK